jgi:transposase
MYLAGSDDIADVDGQREVSRPHSLHQEQVLLLCLFHKLLCLSSVDGESLLAENVLASLESEHSILVVVRVGSSNVDDIDILVGNQLFIRSVCLC